MCLSSSDLLQRSVIVYDVHITRVIKMQEINGTPDLFGALEMQELHEQDQQTSDLSDSNYPIVKAWAKGLRQVPNALIRCGLFTVGNNKNKREFWPAGKPVKVATYGSLEVSFQGEELRQDDLDVLLELIYIYQGKPSKSKVDFPPLHLIRDLGWSKNTASYERLKKCILRLQMGVVSITMWVDKQKTEKLTYNGSFIRWSAFQEKTTENTELSGKGFWIEMDPNLFKFFDAKSFTRLSWDHRKQIHSPLGKFLHAYFSSHDGRVGTNAKQLMHIAGYRNNRADSFRKFKSQVSESLQKLKEIGAIADWTLDGETFNAKPIKWSANPKGLAKPSEG